MKKGYLLFYVAVMAANAISVAWTTGGFNQTANLISAKLNWSDDETRLYNSVINFSSQVGKTLGAIYGGTLIVKGRKKSFIQYNVLSLLTCLIMQILSVPSFIIGKFLNGFTVTVVHIAVLKMISETVPVNHLGSLGSAVMIF